MKLQTTMPEDVFEFIELCLSGKLYRELEGLLFLKTKEETKGKVFQILFCSNNTFVNAKSIAPFRERFPNVSNYLIERKKVGESHIDFAIELQRRESEVIIDTVIPKLIEHDPSMFITTIHDSLIYERRHHDIVITTIQNAFKTKYGIIPQLKQGLPGEDLEPIVINSPSIISLT